MPVGLFMGSIIAGTVLGFHYFIDKYDTKAQKLKAIYENLNSATTKEILRDRTERFSGIFQNIGIYKMGDGAWIECIDYKEEPCYRAARFVISDNLSVSDFTKVKEKIQEKLNTEGTVKELDIFFDDSDGTMIFRAIEQEMPLVPFDLYNYTDIYNIPIGVDIENRLLKWNLKSVPHAIIIGTSGSGKSCLLQMIVAYIVHVLKCPPLFLVDLKNGLEFGIYETVHNVQGFAKNLEQVKKVIADVDKFADDRYEFLAQKGYRNYYDFAKEHPEEAKEAQQFFVIVDEIADLTSQEKKKNSFNANDKLVELSRKIRAAGGHIVVSSQRPTTDSVNATMKANMDLQIGFRVINAHNSKLLLEESGLELLPERHCIGLIKGRKYRFRTMYLPDKFVDQVAKLYKRTPEQIIEAFKFKLENVTEKEITCIEDILNKK